MAIKSRQQSVVVRTPAGKRAVRAVPVVVFPHPAIARALVMITHTGEAFVGRRTGRALVWQEQTLELPRAA